jgi:hypothetical protein
MVYKGPTTGQLEMYGANVDEILKGAMEQIERVARGRTFEIEKVELIPHYRRMGLEVVTWAATVHFSIEEAFACNPDEGGGLADA